MVGVNIIALLSMIMASISFIYILLSIFKYKTMEVKAKSDKEYKKIKGSISKYCDIKKG